MSAQWREVIYIGDALSLWGDLADEFTIKETRELELPVYDRLEAMIQALSTGDPVVKLELVGPGEIRLRDPSYRVLDRKRYRLGASLILRAFCLGVDAAVGLTRPEYDFGFAYGMRNDKLPVARFTRRGEPVAINQALKNLMGQIPGALGCESEVRTGNYILVPREKLSLRVRTIPMEYLYAVCRAYAVGAAGYKVIPGKII